MSTKLFLTGLLAITLLASCSSAYKTGQTPDDVYYSPTRAINDEVRVEEKKQEDYAYNRPDDNYLRMKVQNRRHWSVIDDRDYWYNYDYSCKCNDNWSVYNKWSYNSWDSWYSWNRPNNYYGYNSGWGYGYGYPILYVKTPRSNTGAKPYMSGYTNRTYNNTNNSYSNGKNGKSSTGSNFGNLMKSVFGGANNSSTTNSSDSYSRPVRTFDNSSNSSSTPSSSSSSSSGNSSSGRSSSGSSSSGGRTGRGG